MPRIPALPLDNAPTNDDLLATYDAATDKTKRVTVASVLALTPLPPAGSGLPDGGTTGQVLAKASNSDGDAVWENAPGGNPITVKDEGSSLDTAVTSFDFVGAGVTATNSTHAVTITVPDGGAGKALDSAVVHNTGAETVAGVKTFSSAPVVPSASFPESATTNLVADLAAKAADNAVVHLAGDAMTGHLTLSADPTSSLHAATKNYVDTASTVVHRTAAETIAGVKTFSSSPVVPTPTNPTDAANKTYVDGLAAGLIIHDSVRVASTTNVDVSSAPSTIDGVTLASTNRILLKDQTDAKENGLWTFASATNPLTRATDADIDAEVVYGLFVFVTEGSTNIKTGWAISTPNPITLGTTSITFSQISAAGQVTAGSGLVQSGSVLSVGAGAGISVAAGSVSVDQPSLTLTNLGGTLSIAKGGSGGTTAQAAFDNISPVTTLGDLIYRDAGNNARLAGNTTSSKKYLSQTGTGSVSAAPAWAAIAQSDITNLTSDLALKAPLASPALTGTPTAPTQSPGDNSTKLATTAYTDAAAVAGTPDATSSTKGKIQLAGEIGGSATSIKVRSVITKTVATVSSGYVADFYCDGTADDVEILAAIAALPATGGILMIRQGIYSISANIAVPNNIVVRGEGFTDANQSSAGGTILRRASAYDGPIISGTDSTTGNFNILLEDFSIDGSYANGSPTTASRGIYFTKGQRVLVNRVSVNNTKGDGIKFDGSGVDWITNCKLRGCQGNGIVFGSSGASDCAAWNNEVGSVAGIGISLVSVSNCIIVGNFVFISGLQGIDLFNSSGNVIGSNRINDSHNSGVRLTGTTVPASYNTVTNNILYNNNSVGASDGAAIYITDSGAASAHNNTITSNVCFNTGTTRQKYGVLTDSLADYNTISLNDCFSNATAAVSHIGTNDIVFGNMGNNDKPLIASNNLSDLASVSTARANLGLGTMALQAASGVSITGGSITGITDIAVADGGTGVSTITGIIKGNGASAFTAATAGTDYLSPTGSGAGLSGILLTSNNLSDVASATTSFTNIKQNATTGATGVVQLAGDLGGTAASPTVSFGNDTLHVLKVGDSMSGPLVMTVTGASPASPLLNIVQSNTSFNHYLAYIESNQATTLSNDILRLVSNGGNVGSRGLYIQQNSDAGAIIIDATGAPHTNTGNGVQTVFNIDGANNMYSMVKITNSGISAISNSNMFIQNTQATTTARVLQLHQFGTGSAFYIDQDSTTSPAIEINSSTYGLKITSSDYGLTLLGGTGLHLDGTRLGTLTVDRNTASGSGARLEVTAGGAQAGQTNTAGGELRLSSGIPTGNSTSDVTIRTYVGSISGTADASVHEIVRIFGSGGANGRVAIGATTLRSGADGLTLGGDVARVLWMNRATSTSNNGFSLTVQSGSSASGSTDKSAGNLVIGPGISTGAGSGSTIIQATAAGSSGTTDNNPINIITVTTTTVDFASTKLTSIANGTAGSDAAAFGQIPISAATIGGLLAASNLSDLASASTARTNLGLGTLATQSGTFSGTSSGTNTGDQTITLTGNVTGSGTGSFATTIAAAAVTNSMLAGSITASKLVGTDITTLGTITAGVWNGTAINHSYLTGIVQADVGGLTTASTPTFAGLNLGTSNLSTVGNIAVDGSAVRDMTMARATSGAGNSMTIQAGGAQSGATSTAGGTLFLVGGIATGSNAGRVIVQTAGGGSAGTSDVSPNTTMTFSGSNTAPIALLGATLSGTVTGYNMNGNLAMNLFHQRHTTANTAGNNLTITSGGATSGATNKAAGNLVLTTGLSTGSGGGSVLIQTTGNSAGSTSDNSLTTRVTIDQTAVTTAADLKLGTAGNGLYVKEGTNATMGVGTLVLGTVTISTTKVTASSRIFLTVQSLGTVAVATPVAVTARSAGTSFTITSSSATDTSVVAWMIVEPA